jgi:hypothetical protein
MNTIDEIVDAINRHIDLPLLTEEQERIIIKAVVTLLITVLSKKNS